jgi:hypothetical protein
MDIFDDILAEVASWWFEQDLDVASLQQMMCLRGMRQSVFGTVPRT